MSDQNGQEGQSAPGTHPLVRAERARTSAPQCVVSTTVFQLEDVLTTQVADALLERILAQIGPLDRDGGVFGVEIPELTGALEQLIPMAGELFDADDLAGKMETQLLVHTNGRHSLPQVEQGQAAISFDYFLCRRPREFTGGQLRIYDQALSGGRTECAASFRDIHPLHDTLVMYPATAWREVTLIHCPSEDPSCGRFAIHGQLK